MGLYLINHYSQNYFPAYFSMFHIETNILHDHLAGPIRSWSYCTSDFWNE